MIFVVVVSWKICSKGTTSYMHSGELEDLCVGGAILVVKRDVKSDVDRLLLLLTYILFIYRRR